MKAVIDTNVFVSAFFGGNPKKVLDLVDTKNVTFCVSDEITEEYLRIFIRMKRSQEALEDLLRYCREDDTVESTIVLPRLSVVKEDPDDNKFIECAIALKADYIVTGDRALLSVDEYEGIQIVTPREFVEIAEHAKRKK
jgi:putative PIN family toxin of toxin-antitoxin system